eukprot:6472107-Amphidinium_carterae.1
MVLVCQLWRKLSAPFRSVSVKWKPIPQCPHQLWWISVKPTWMTRIKTWALTIARSSGPERPRGQPYRQRAPS